MRVSVFIPAYNAEKHIDGVIKRIPNDAWELISAVYIVNDGSRDGTKQIVDALVLNNKKIIPIHFAQNKGYGKAVSKGLDLCRNDNCDFAVCLHSDGQYPPEFIVASVKKMVQDGIDVLQGSRIASGTAITGGMPLYKFIAGKVLTFLENIVFKMYMTDYHSGFLLYSRKALDNLNLSRLSSSFDFDLEVIAMARSRGLRISELAIPTRYADEESHLNPITYGLRVLKVLIKYKAGLYR